MIPMRDLGDDYYDFDEKNYCLVGRRRHHIYQLGDPIRIQVAKANLEKKQLDFTLEGNEANTYSGNIAQGKPAKQSHKKDSKKRRRRS